ncbi:MAG: PQQ-dependent sugar dehydrogenase [Pirellulales bacterium]
MQIVRVLSLSFVALFVLSAVRFASAAEVDTSPLAIEAVRAYPNLKFDLPVLLTHAGDGTQRTFLVAQKGVIHILPKDAAGDETTQFLDISDRTLYNEKENEQGLLGVAFHPKFKENGQFFVYYSTTEKPLTTVISRFRVSKDDPNRADPDSEEEIWRLTHPYWNHKGGTIVFGPDGYLYIGLGDGGAGGDPHGNGQNLNTWFASILRIDVDHRDAGKKYAVPKDNPFVGRKDAKGEIWAYGVRNIWRMAFDRKTGTLWAGDVGQDLWEEINIIRRGGNYGWSIREGTHPFGKDGVGKRDDLIDPIWEYHHNVGKSITGGHVYRGKKLPELDGMYLYADYVTGLMWALSYDAQSKTVTANRPIHAQPLPVMSFGEDEAGESYFLARSGEIYTLSRASK